MDTNHNSKLSLFKKISFFAEENSLIDPNKAVILGFSGGPDSRFLLEWLLWHTKKTNPIILAHLNHEWRIDADKEQEHCFAIAQRFGLGFATQKISHYQSHIAYNGSKEAFARDARRIFLEELAQKHNGIIALGHHQDDQIETFFIRLARGSTATGLAGMRPRNGLYIRPLLEVRKDQILAQLNQLNIDYCKDSSNESKDYLRNDIRLSLIPTLNAVDKRFLNNIVRTIKQLQNAEQSFTNQTKTVIKNLELEKDSLCLIDKKKFLNLDSYMQKRVLIELLIRTKHKITIQNSTLDEIIRFLSNKSLCHRFSKMIWTHQNKEHFWFKPSND